MGILMLLQIKISGCGRNMGEGVDEGKDIEDGVFPPHLLKLSKLDVSCAWF
jgi:hypothetical protein